MRLIVLRHGESQANVDDVINDNPARPVPLTVRGQAQARAAAERVVECLAAEPFAKAWCSEFLRTRQTAEIILRGQGCLLLEDARLNERRSMLDGQPTAAFNDLVRPDPVTIRPPGGETFVEVMARMAAFLEAIRHEPKGPLLAVTHENPLLALIRLLLETPEAAVHRTLPNCALIECWLGQDGWCLKSYSES